MIGALVVHWLNLGGKVIYSLYERVVTVSRLDVSVNFEGPVVLAKFCG